MALESSETLWQTTLLTLPWTAVRNRAEDVSADATTNLKNWRLVVARSSAKPSLATVQSLQLRHCAAPSQFSVPKGPNCNRYHALLAPTSRLVLLSTAIAGSLGPTRTRVGDDRTTNRRVSHLSNCCRFTPQSSSYAAEACSARQRRRATRNQSEACVVPVPSPPPGFRFPRRT